MHGNKNSSVSKVTALLCAASLAVPGLSIIIVLLRGRDTIDLSLLLLIVLAHVILSSVLIAIVMRPVGQRLGTLADEAAADRMQTAVATEALARLDDRIARLRSRMDSVADKSRQLNESSMGLYRIAFSQSSELESVSGEMGQFASQISDIADHSRRASELALQTLQVTGDGLEHMHDLVAANSAISTSSQRILDVLDTIDQIASQTRLLALNATIEAARAGQHGRAFAVVAGEVKDLSVHSTSAAQETSGLVDDAIQNLSEGQSISAKTVEALTHIENEVRRVSEIIEEIARASSLQAETVNRLDVNLKEISQLNHQQKAVAKEATSTSLELVGHVDHLADELRTVRGLDGGRDGVPEGTARGPLPSTSVNRPLRFVGKIDFGPHTYVDNGQAVGLFIDLTRELIEHRMGIQVEYELMEWPRCNEEMRQGLRDAYFTVMTGDRSEFCATHLNIGYVFDWVLWTSAGHPMMDTIRRIRTPEDIIASGLVCGSYHGNGWLKTSLEDRGAKVAYFDNEFAQLAAKKVDIVPEEPLQGRYKIRSCGIPQDLIVEIPVVLTTASFQYLIQKDSPYVGILPSIDAHLLEMNQDGTMARLLARYQ